jgi:hypothetical protein
MNTGADLTWSQFCKTFLSVIYKFSHYAGAFVRLGWVTLLGTNTLAYGQKCFITLGLGVDFIKLFLVRH